MARYIDADALKTDILKKYKQNWEVPCSYEDRIIQRVVTDLRVLIEQNTPADVVPKSEVERLKAELDWIQSRHPFAITLFELEACEKHAAIKAVKEVWRELRSKCDDPHWCVWLSEIDDYFEKKTGVKTEDIAELKKKYTEDKG